ncbi:MAG: choice-of-anchor D domain-containing protein [Planctomycetota bacterium]
MSSRVSRRQISRRRLSSQTLESRRLLAVDLQLTGAGEVPFLEIEDDPRLLDFFHGPRIPGAPVPPIQGIAPLADAVESLEVASNNPLDNSGDGDEGGPEEVPPFPLEDTFKLHSRPDSNFTIYLDFDGHVTVGTSWNAAYGIPEIVHPNYWGVFGEAGKNFTNGQLEVIQEIWQIVAEDFAPFDVNVTTEEPADLDDLRRVGSEDTRWGSRSLMTKDTFASCGCGGHAFLGAFDDRTDEPAITYNGGVNAGSETVSHEVGHQLGLRHDGNGGNTYYRGHGTGDTGWGPIMGAPFSKRTTHWNAGDYFTANEDEDDLTIITRSVNFPYLEDDVTNDRNDAIPLREIGSTEVEAFGIIERNDDVDWYQFTTGAGDVAFNFDVLGYKPNLDVWAGLFDSAGTFIAEANPQDALSASFDSVTLDAGTYYLKIDGVARDGSYNALLDEYVEPSPAPYTVSGPAGYSDYGSIGQYRISGTIVDPGQPTVSIGAVANEVQEGGTAEVTLTTSDGSSANLTVEIRAARQSAPGLPSPHPASSDDLSVAMTQQVTITDGSGTLQIPTIDDAEVEFDEVFEVLIVDSDGYQVADRAVAVQILESKTNYRAVETFASSTKSPEGDSGSGTTHQFTVLRDGNTDAEHVVTWNRVPVAGAENQANNADFVSPATGTVTFAPGETEKLIEIEIAGDVGEEEDEVYGIELAVTFGETYSVSAPNGPVVGTIVNDEATITIEGDVRLEELDSGVTVQTVTVTRGGFVEKAVSVDWVLNPSGDDPVAASDFENGLPSGTVNFAADATTAEIEFRVLGDEEIEADETFDIVFSNNSGGPEPALKGGVVVNDDFALPEINVKGAEGATIADGDDTPSEDDGTLYPLAKVVDMTIDQVFTVENLGVLPLTLTEFKVEGANASDFAVAYAGPGSLDPGASAEFTVSFDPTAAGARAATVVIDNDDPDESSYSFAVAGSATSLDIESIEINDVSRSQLPSVTVTFNETVVPASLVQAFQVYTVGGQQFFPSYSYQASDINDKTVVTFSFRNDSIVDGFYEMRILSREVESTSDPSYPLYEDYFFGPGRGDEAADSFFRFYGDSDGDQDVDRDDLSTFRAAWLSDSSSGAFDSKLDFDSDGTIDATDFAEFRKRMGRRL